MSFLSGKKLLALGIVVVLLAAIPLAVYLLQQQQETRSRAQKSTVLSLVPSPQNVKAGEKFSLDVMMNPGSNNVYRVAVHILFDKDKIATASTTTASGCTSGQQDGICAKSTLSLTPNSAGEMIQYAEPGNFMFILATTPDAFGITTQTKVATITFEAKATTGATPTQIAFGNSTSVTTKALEGGDDEPNVLSSTSPASVTITEGTSTTPTPTISITPTPPTTTQTITPTITPTPTASPSLTGAANQPPVCTALNLDRAPSGTAPFSITFTANGNDPSGTVSKVTFDFGDGPVQDVNQNAGISSVSVQVAHTYRNPGTYRATATLTDNSSATSAPNANCAQTITVTQNVGAGTGGGTVTGGTGNIIISTPTPVPTIASPGPGNKIIGVGVIGAMLSIAGALLFFAL